MDKRPGRRAPAPAGAALATRFVDDYLLYLLARASHVASAEFHGRLARRGIAVPVWRVLASLSGVEAVTVGELSRRVLLKQPTLTKVLDRMAASGLIARTGSPSDRRQVLVSATPAGQALLDGVLDEAKDHERSVMAALGTEGEAFKRALHRLVDALDRRLDPRLADHGS